MDRWPGAAAESRVRADRILAGRYDLLAYDGLSYDSGDGAVDWHFDPVHRRKAPRTCWANVPYLDARCGDHKIIWELNRHQHWLALTRGWWLTGEPQYRQAVVDQLSSWLAANPPLIGINWASMLEIALRSIMWVWALHTIRTDDTATEPWVLDILLGLHRQLTHVEQHLSVYFSPNTHLTGEALALYVVGQVLPELVHAERWADTGRRILIEELDRQVGADGGHAERSTHYHRYTLDFYLLALLVATRSGDTAAQSRFRDGVARMAAFLRVMADDNGRTPQLGDEDGGMLWPIAGRQPHDVRDSLSLAAIVLGDPALAPWGLQEEAVWLGFATHGDRVQQWAASQGAPGLTAAHSSGRVAAPIETRVFPDTGYLVVREGAASHLVFDVGPHGYLNGGHAHADSLAMTLALNGHPFLVDPGTGTYTMDPLLRDRMRSSAAHNTLTLDGASPSIPAGPFHWHSGTDGRLESLRHNAGFAYAAGAHDGYAGARYRRTIVRVVDAGMLVVDEIGGRDRHTAQLHWHFGPDWEVACVSARQLRAQHADGTRAWFVRDSGNLWLARGDAETGLGWYSPRYGALVATWAARVTRTAHAPFEILTWIGTGEEPPSMERVHVETDGAGHAIAVRMVEGGSTRVTVTCPGEPAVRHARSCTTGEYHTDARMLHYAVRDSELVELAIADATHLLPLRDGLLSIAADDHINDLHVVVAGDVLELVACGPIPRISLQGAALTRLARVKLNGREVPVNIEGCAASLVIAASEWATPPPGVQPLQPVTGVASQQSGTVACVE